MEPEDIISICLYTTETFKDGKSTLNEGPLSQLDGIKIIQQKMEVEAKKNNRKPPKVEVNFIVIPDKTRKIPAEKTFYDNDEYNELKESFIVKAQSKIGAEIQVQDALKILSKEEKAYLENLEAKGSVVDLCKHAVMGTPSKQNIDVLQMDSNTLVNFRALYDKTFNQTKPAFNASRCSDYMISAHNKICFVPAKDPFSYIISQIQHKYVTSDLGIEDQKAGPAKNGVYDTCFTSAYWLSNSNLLGKVQGEFTKKQTEVLGAVSEAVVQKDKTIIQYLYDKKVITAEESRDPEILSGLTFLVETKERSDPNKIYRYFPVNVEALSKLESSGQIQTLVGVVIPAQNQSWRPKDTKARSEAEIFEGILSTITVDYEGQKVGLPAFRTIIKDLADNPVWFMGKDNKFNAQKQLTSFYEISTPKQFEGAVRSCAIYKNMHDHELLVSLASQFWNKIDELSVDTQQKEKLRSHLSSSFFDKPGYIHLSKDMFGMNVTELKEKLPAVAIGCKTILKERLQSSGLAFSDDSAVIKTPTNLPKSKMVEGIKKR